jgi:hypothetical protein
MPHPIDDPTLRLERDVPLARHDPSPIDDAHVFVSEVTDLEGLDGSRRLIDQVDEQRGHSPPSPFPHGVAKLAPPAHGADDTEHLLIDRVAVAGSSNEGAPVPSNIDRPPFARPRDRDPGAGKTPVGAVDRRNLRVLPTCPAEGDSRRKQEREVEARPRKDRDSVRARHRLGAHVSAAG